MKNLILLLFIAGLQCCTTGKKENPEYNPRAIELNKKGQLLIQQYKRDSALILFDQATAVDSTYYLAYSNKIGIYLARKEFDKALLASEEVVKKKTDSAEGWFMAGLLNEHQGNNEKALAYYMKSIEIFTDRINDPALRKNINTNKLNRALSKKFVGDESCMHDFNELINIDDCKTAVIHFKDKTKEEIMEMFFQ